MEKNLSLKLENFISKEVFKGIAGYLGFGFTSDVNEAKRFTKMNLLQL